MQYDVFICHASEDKETFVRPLAEALRSRHVEVWYDEFSLRVGDSLRESIDHGLSSSRFGILVLSPDFFQKPWTNRELNGFVAREMNGEKNLILPVWHNTNKDEILKFSPPLANTVGVPSNIGIDKVVDRLLEKIQPEDSPLIVARNFLIEKDYAPRVVTDEWWLDMVELKEAEFLHPDLNAGWRWIFPLPYPEGIRGKKRGLNIAWTALQFDWAKDGMEREICQLTHPDIVHDYLDSWPGLRECAHRNPAILALYAPQLTIPGFDTGFEKVFDTLIDTKSHDCDAFRYSDPSTTDNQPPLCGDFIAWRHTEYGNYTAGELSYIFASAHDTSYFRSSFNGFECLVWLLSNNSDWMPEKLHATLIKGYKERVFWWVEVGNGLSFFPIIENISNQSSTKVNYTITILKTLHELCANAIESLEIDDDPIKITEKFIEHEFLEAYIEEQDRLKEARKG